MNMLYPPTHPGEILREDVLPELGLSIAELARRVGVSRVQLSRLLHGHIPLTAGMAVPLEQIIPAAVIETWMRMQVARDLWVARQARRIAKNSQAITV
jgi:addiction module HigA family antidote